MKLYLRIDSPIRVIRDNWISLPINRLQIGDIFMVVIKKLKVVTYKLLETPTPDDSGNYFVLNVAEIDIINNMIKKD